MSKTLHYDFATDKSLTAITGPTLTCTRAGATATYFDASGVLQTASADTARFDHDPANSNASLGLLVENAATNLCLQSEAFGTSPWAAWGSSTVTANDATAPDGNVTADKITADGANAGVNQTITLVATTSYVVSVFAKDIDADAAGISIYDNTAGSVLVHQRWTWSGGVPSAGYSTGSPTQVRADDVGGGWYRLSYVFTTSGNTAFRPVILSHGLGLSNHFWGANLVADSIVTSYIATTTTAVARNRDDIQTTTVTWLDTASTAVGTFYAKFSVPHAPAGGTGTIRRVFFLYGGWSNTISMYCNNGDSVIDAESANTGDNGRVVGDAMVDNTSMEVALGYADDDFLMVVDGTAKTKDTAASFPMTADSTRLIIGDLYFGNFALNGHIQELRYYDERLTDAQLEVLPDRLTVGPFELGPHGLTTKRRTFSTSVDVSATGAAIAATSGTSTSAVGIDVTITGVSISAENGDVTATADVNYASTGAEMAAAAAAVTVTTDINYTLSGAGSAGEAGTVTASIDKSVDLTGAQIIAARGQIRVGSYRTLGPHGLIHKGYGAFNRSPFPQLIGKSTAASAGVVNVVSTSSVKYQLGPHGLVSYRRNFSKQILQNVSVNLTGAHIQGQWNTPDIADTDVNIDGAAISSSAATVIADADNDEVVELTGAAIAAAAGTAAGTGSIDVSISGAESSADAAAVVASGAGGTFVTIVGAETGADTGTVTPAYDWAQTITGAEITGYHAEVGIDTNSDLSVTVYTAGIDAEAGTVTAPGTVDIDRIGRTKQRKRRRRKKKRKPRYIVEVNKQYFEVTSVQAAQEMLQQVRSLADDAAEQDVKATAPPRVRVKTGSGNVSKSKTIQADTLKTQRAVDEAYNRAVARRAIDAEISKLLLAKIAAEDEEEEAILALLLS